MDGSISRASPSLPPTSRPCLWIEHTLLVDEVAELFVSAADKPGVAESQRKPLVCIRRAFSFTVDAASTIKQSFVEFWKTLSPEG